MPVTVSINIPEIQGDSKVIRQENYEITPIKLNQFTALLKHVKDLLVYLKEEGSLMDLFSELLTTDEAKKWLSSENPEEVTTEQVTNLMADSDKNFIITLVQSFEGLVMNVPDLAVNILVSLSGIPREKLEQQELEKVFEVLDAVVEVNDLEKLFDRLKKSLGATARKYKFLTKARQATAE